MIQCRRDKYREKFLSNMFTVNTGTGKYFKIICMFTHVFVLIEFLSEPNQICYEIFSKYQISGFFLHLQRPKRDLIVSLIVSWKNNEVYLPFTAALPKRFYKNTGVLQSNGKFEITLDNRKLKTPTGTVLIVNSEPLALGKIFRCIWMN